MKKVFDEIEVIATFKGIEQIFFSVFGVAIEQIKTEKKAKDYFGWLVNEECVSLANKEAKNCSLLKISICFLNCKKNDVPKWVIKTNGKLFYKEVKK